MTRSRFHLAAVSAAVLLFPGATFAQSLLYSNGGLNPQATSNSGVASPAGFFWSEVQNDTGNTTESNTIAGFGAIQGSNRVADDFVVPAGATYTIQAIDFYGYQTGASAAATPFTGYTLQIWNGRPGDAGATVIFGDATTNRFASSENTTLYRVFNTSVPPPGTAPGTTRTIWRNRVTVDPPLTLTAGTYWVDWASTVTANANHFHPAVTLQGARGAPGWNGRQFTVTTSTWADLLDTGNPATAPDVVQDMPFDIIGTGTLPDPIFDHGFEDPAPN